MPIEAKPLFRPDVLRSHVAGFEFPQSNSGDSNSGDSIHIYRELCMLSPELGTPHGADDPAVKVSRSRNMIEALKKAGGAPRYTEYPAGGHNCWEPATREPDLLPWLFKQQRAP